MERWGTWIRFCKFVADNFDSIREAISSIDGQENFSALEKLNKLLNNQNAEFRLYEVVEVYFLAEAIVKLETRGLLVEETNKNSRSSALEALRGLSSIHVKIAREESKLDAVFKQEEDEI